MSIRDIPVILGFGFAVFSGYITDTVCPGCPMRLRSHEVSGPILNGSYPEVPLIWMSEVSKKDLHILKSIQIRSNRPLPLDIVKKEFGLFQFKP